MRRVFLGVAVAAAVAVVAVVVYRSTHAEGRLQEEYAHRFDVDYGEHGNVYGARDNAESLCAADALEQVRMTYTRVTPEGQERFTASAASAIKAYCPDELGEYLTTLSVLDADLANRIESTLSE